MDVSAVIVTRGDVDLEPSLAPIRDAGVDDIVIWNNATRPEDLQVAGRYEAIAETRHDLIYSQDDDCIVPVDELLAAYEDGLLVNVPPGEQPWLAWGALFDRSLPNKAFQRYGAAYDFDDALFCRWADVVFAHLNGWRTIDLGHQDLPWATAPNRMYHQPDHYISQQLVRDRCLALAHGDVPVRA